MAVVVIMLRAILVAVAALSLVEPTITSGPTSRVTTRSAGACSGSLQLTSTLAQPTVPAYSRADITKGVPELAAIPTTMSSPESSLARRASTEAVTESSAPSTAFHTASRPPAMTACTVPGSVPKVGGHSAASITPSRPLVPAPTKKTLPPRSSDRKTMSAARDMESFCLETA